MPGWSQTRGSRSGVSTVRQSLMDATGEMGSQGPKGLRAPAYDFFPDSPAHATWPSHSAVITGCDHHCAGVLGLRGRQAGAPLPPQCISSTTHTAGAQEIFVGQKRRKDRPVGGAGYSPARPTQGAPRSTSSPLLSTLGWLSALRLRVVGAGVAPTSPTAPASDARGGGGADMTLGKRSPLSEA